MINNLIIFFLGIGIGVQIGTAIMIKMEEIVRDEEYYKYHETKKKK